MTYIDEFQGRMAVGRPGSIPVVNNTRVELDFDHYASGLLRITVVEDGPDARSACAKVNAIQLRLLIADLQARLGYMTG